MSGTPDEDFYFVICNNAGVTDVTTHTREAVLELLKDRDIHPVPENLDHQRVSFNQGLDPYRVLIVKGRLARLTAPEWKIE